MVTNDPHPRASKTRIESNNIPDNARRVTPSCEMRGFLKAARQVQVTKREGQDGLGLLN